MVSFRPGQKGKDSVLISAPIYLCSLTRLGYLQGSADLSEFSYLTHLSSDEIPLHLSIFLSAVPQ